jgi:hypothetical protein
LQVLINTNIISAIAASGDILQSDRSCMGLVCLPHQYYRIIAQWLQDVAPGRNSESLGSMARCLAMQLCAKS